MPVTDLDGEKAEQRFYQATQYLIESLGHDLDSGQPSQEPKYLKAVNDGVFQVQFLGQAHKTTRALLQKFQMQYEPAIKVKPYRLLSETLQKADAERINEYDFLHLCEELGMTDDTLIINFLTQFFEIVRLLPMKVFRSEENRTRLLDAMQRALDVAIEME